MKKLLFGAMLAGSMLSLTGCLNTPGYSCGFPTIGTVDAKCTGEHWNRIIRNQRNESDQFVEEADSFLLLDPGSHMTKWNVR